MTEHLRAVTNARNITRRHALNRIAVSGAGALAISSIPRDASARRFRSTKINTMTSDELSRFIGRRFQVKGAIFCDDRNERNVELRLEQVIENDFGLIKDWNGPSHFRPYSVSLLFSANRELPNSTHSITNDTLGESLLFIHQIRRDDYPDKRIYEVILG